MLRGVRQQQDKLERFSICCRQAAVVLKLQTRSEEIFGVRNQKCKRQQSAVLTLIYR